jgi:prenylated cyclic peptide (anacyclamide/piricyclamide family)
MTKKNIRPQQVAPVERETISTSKDQSGQITPSADNEYGYKLDASDNYIPFAGDDAE